MSTTTPTRLERGVFVNGAAEPIETEGRAIVNPGTGNLVGLVTSATPETADRAVRAACDAFPGWARLGYSDRGRILHRCAEAFESHVEELAPILVAEQGKTIREASCTRPRTRSSTTPACRSTSAVCRCTGSTRVSTGG